MWDTSSLWSSGVMNRIIGIWILLIVGSMLVLFIVTGVPSAYYVPRLMTPCDLPARPPHEGNIRFSNFQKGWTPPKLPDHLQKADQEDPELIQHIHDVRLLHPTNAERNLTRPNVLDNSQHHHAPILEAYFHNKTEGFYIECGALNGESLSNTLYFERKLHWDGLLIEADPGLFQELLTKHRHAYSVNACVSPTRTAQVMNYTIATYMGGLVDQNVLLDQMTHVDIEFRHSFTQIQCLPFYSIMAALGNRHVDFFSLDIEGAEVDVLKTIPLDKMNIDVFVVEIDTKRGQEANNEKIREITDILQPYGYKIIETPLVIDVVLSKI